MLEIRVRESRCEEYIETSEHRKNNEREIETREKNDVLINYFCIHKCLVEWCIHHSQREWS